MTPNDFRIRCGKLYPWHSTKIVQPWNFYCTKWIRRGDGRELAGVTLFTRRRVYVRADTVKEMRLTCAHELHHILLMYVRCNKGDGSLEEYIVRESEATFAAFLDGLGYWDKNPIPEEFHGFLKDEED